MTLPEHLERTSGDPCPCCHRPMLRDGNLSVDLNTNVLVVDGHAVQLTSTQAELASCLLSKSPAWLHRDRLMVLLYGSYVNDVPEDKIINVLISQIRNKLTGTRVVIQSNRDNSFRMYMVPRGEGRSLIMSAQEFWDWKDRCNLTWPRAGEVLGISKRSAESHASKSKSYYPARAPTVKLCHLLEQHGMLTGGDLFAPITTAPDFKRWRSRCGYRTWIEAAGAMGISPRSVFDYTSKCRAIGHRVIPKYLSHLCNMIEYERSNVHREIRQHAA